MAKKDKHGSTAYEVITQEDENGDLLIPIPPAVLQSLGWKEGDQIDFALDDKGNIVMKKADV
jgi:bifunctional DNA-binding transcriptional regulator/antitoxin component of YhaV-PrlF toxin-antitoxin module